MCRALLPLVASLVMTCSACAALQDALLAQVLLKDTVDARTVRISYADQTVHGVAFALEHCLWLYTPASGTRVLGAAPEQFPDATEFAARLKHWEPGVNDLRIEAQPPRPIAETTQSRLQTGCVIVALKRLTDLLVASELNDAGLVLLSYTTGSTRVVDGMLVDHCLLVTRFGDRWECFDPIAPEKSFAPQWLDVGRPLDPILVERTVSQRYAIKSARLLQFRRDTLAKLKEAQLWRTMVLDGARVD